MAGLRPYILSFMIVLLFAFALIGFSSQFLIATNPNSQLLQSGLSNISRPINNTLNNFASTSMESYNQLSTADASPTDYIFLIFRGAFDIPRLFLQLILDGGYVLQNILFIGFGGTPFAGILSIVVSIIFASLLITVVFLVIKAIRSGESER